MKGLREKFRNKKGFTLVEMLVVVAIIAILVAVSIPIVNSALERARNAVDEANMRSAAALVQIQYLTDQKPVEGYYKVDKDAGSQGTLVDDKDEATVGQCTGSGHATCEAGGHTDKVIHVAIDNNGTVTAEWVNQTTDP